MPQNVLADDLNVKWVYRRYIVKDGKRIYPKNAKVFRFAVKD